MNHIDAIMEAASAKLAAMDYAECERLCVESLRLAREAKDFDRYARILLPLQECRRQRRQIAADAGVALLGEPKLPAAAILEKHPRGCVLLLSPPYSQDDERAVREEARKKDMMVEALLLQPEGLRACFEQQMEREGDHAVAAVPKNLTPEDEVAALEGVLDRVGDHEIAHQRLAAAARRASREQVR